MRNVPPGAPLDLIAAIVVTLMCTAVIITLHRVGGPRLAHRRHGRHLRARDMGHVAPHPCTSPCHCPPPRDRPHTIEPGCRLCNSRVEATNRSSGTARSSHDGSPSARLYGAADLGSFDVMNV